MAEVLKYPKRLIEVDLPIKEISAHARREKSIRHGHISTLHIWWARRPLAACRAVLCASLWPDPADPLCPQSFREEAAKVLCEFAEKVRTDRELARLCQTHWERWLHTDAKKYAALTPAVLVDMRKGLLDFIADFANWDSSSNGVFLAVASRLTRTAHGSLALVAGGAPKPLVVDPFAGGGAIPLEALRVGADSFASDLNPIPVLLNRVVLEYIPRSGRPLADEVRRVGQEIKERVTAELDQFYSKRPNGTVPIAYLWARTVTCEGPACGATVPMLKSLWLAQKGGRSVALRLVIDRQRKDVQFDIVEGKPKNTGGTVARGSVTCPICGYTTSVQSVRRQLSKRCGGTADARLICVVCLAPGQQGRVYERPTREDFRAVQTATEQLAALVRSSPASLCFAPDEPISLNELRRISVPIYGMVKWRDLFASRQTLSLGSTALAVRSLGARAGVEVQTCLALALGRIADSNSALATWATTGEFVRSTFGRQAIPMVWDFVECNPWSGSSGNWDGAVEWIARVIESVADAQLSVGQAVRASATRHPLPDDSADAIFTDPPYYDAVPYAHLSDFFYVWLRRCLGDAQRDLFGPSVVAKEEEIVVDRPHERSTSRKDVAFYELELAKAFSDARRVLRPNGIATVVFASKTTASWEAVLQAVMSAGFIVTASWPIDSERGARLAAQGQARLGSSIHLVCRPRENPDGSLRTDDVGSWRSVLAQLPPRIHDWMPRLAEEGVVGADAIFACLGPALEIFSQYSRVEKASGEVVSLREYLEQVWAGVAREALSLMFEGADASGLEEDARLTAMWLWTLGAGTASQTAEAFKEDDDSVDEDTDETGTGKLAGFVLEYDAARKIAQGLGAHLDKLNDVVEVKAQTARLLSVSERAKHLFGKEDLAPDAPKQRKVKESKKQLGLFAEIEAAEEQGLLGTGGVPKVGETTLDKLHQSMILFGAGRSEALKRFIVEEGVGKDGRFWKLAQSLSALYPSGSEEKRWVDGVLARKKGLGF